MNQMIYEGKAKKIFATENPNQVKIFFKDDLTAFNAVKKGSFLGKGIINQKITAILFKELSSKALAHHLIEVLDERTLLAEKVTIIPIEVVVRNYLTGSLAKKLGKEEGAKLDSAIVEFYLKNDELADPFLNEDQITVLGFADHQQLTEMRRQALLINQIISPMLAMKKLILADFKVEFGTNSKQQIILADEMTPDTCRLWDQETLKKFDKDIFRRDLGSVESAYQEVLRRLTSSSV